MREEQHFKNMTQKEGVANIPHKKVQTVSTKPDMIFGFWYQLTTALWLV